MSLRNRLDALFDVLISLSLLKIMNSLTLLLCLLLELGLCVFLVVFCLYFSFALDLLLQLELF